MEQLIDHYMLITCNRSSNEPKSDPYGIIVQVLYFSENKFVYSTKSCVNQVICEQLHMTFRNPYTLIIIKMILEHFHNF